MSNDADIPDPSEPQLDPCPEAPELTTEFIPKLHSSASFRQPRLTGRLLLTRLAEQYGATAKPANGCLLFVPSGEAKAASGQALTPVTVDLEKDGGSYDATFADRKDYGAVTARWRDQGASEDIEETVSDEDAGGPTFTLRNTYPDAAAARAAASAKLASLKSGTVTLSLDGIIGKPTATAEAPLTLINAHPDIDAVSWRIKEAEHSLTTSGLTTRIEAEAKK